MVRDYRLLRTAGEGLHAPGVWPEVGAGFPLRHKEVSGSPKHGAMLYVFD